MNSQSAYANIRLMKHRSTTPVSSSSFAMQAASVACAVLMAIAMPMQIGKTVRADYESQIKSEQEKESNNTKYADSLSVMASSYEDEVRRLSAQIDDIRASINRNEVQKQELGKKIDSYQKDIDASREALNDILVDIYVSSDVSPLEMVASSKTIGDYVDEQSKQEIVQDKLQDKINEIDKLNKQLNEQKAKVENIIKSQKAQENQIAAKQSEKDSLARKTRGEESSYRNLASQNNKKIQELRTAQAEENRRAAEAAMAEAARLAGQRAGGTFSVPVGNQGDGGYPYMAGPLDYGVDPWGLYYRECVSYAAWKVASTGRFVPHFNGAGNARQWPSTVAQYGIGSGSAPRAGSVAMWPVGYYGHVMYVESVNSDGTITVSDYNLEWDGLYRKYTRSASGLTYIYF